MSKARAIAVVFGLIIAGVGLTAHVAGRIGSTAPWLGVLSFPIFDVILFTAGMLVLLHGLLWRVSVERRVLQRSIDYLWYLGAATALLLGTLDSLRQSDIETYQADIAKYTGIRLQAINELSRLIEHCSDPSYKYRTIYEDIVPTEDRAPPDEVCSLAVGERWDWVSDGPIRRLGVEIFELVPTPALTDSEALGEAVQREWRLGEATTEQGRRFCELAKVEWEESEWLGVYEDSQTALEERVLPSYRNPEIKTPRGNIRLLLINPPPHRFGTVVCEMHERLRSLASERAQRSVTAIPSYIAVFTPSWAIILGGVIAVRVVKTTAEVRSERKPRSTYDDLMAAVNQASNKLADSKARLDELDRATAKCDTKLRSLDAAIKQVEVKQAELEAAAKEGQRRPDDEA